MVRLGTPRRDSIGYDTDRSGVSIKALERLGLFISRTHGRRGMALGFFNDTNWIFNDKGRWEERTVA